ncbi:hypothetical protein [Lyngbya sp. CCY1209]|uniref:hypothetical protein n=1 Tax=Lyngbya sp. CCY1209 TaxID=2886103 RepID=UPI002D215E19|nr:hypothetical protein [Lyngbya sp. CCY1209]MEB3886303.1 hypothetical protein [Lyngbya sp. CCY1209]
MFLFLKTRQFWADRPNFDCHERGGGDPQVRQHDRDRRPAGLILGSAYFVYN